MTTQSERDKAVAKPWSVYKTPEEVLNDDTLTDAQKRRILESWERDARELAVAEEENMGGGEPAMLDQVLGALATLPAEDERPRGPATKHGSQPTPGPTEDGSHGATITGAEARQGEIILKSPVRRAIFFGAIGLAFIVFLFFVYLSWSGAA